MNGNIRFTLDAFLAGLVGLLAIMAYLLPRLTRPDLYFAVTVEPQFRQMPEGEKILAHYRLQILAHALIAFVIVIVAWMEAPAAGIVGIFWMLGGALVAFLRARRQVMPHAARPAAIHEAELAPSRERLPGGWLAQILPFALLACIAVYLQIHWNQIPGRFPIHWNLNGQPNGWATRSFGGVYWPLVMGAVFAALLALMGREILRGTRHIHASGMLAANEARFRRIMVWITLASEYFLALVFAWTGLMPLRTIQPSGPIGEAKAILLLTLALTVAVVALMAHVGQGGSALRSAAGIESAARPGEPLGDRTADRFWKAGMIYVNRDDPAILVEKRFGFGYTLNFGHPVTWLILAVLILLIILAPVFATKFAR